MTRASSPNPGGARPVPGPIDGIAWLEGSVTAIEDARIPTSDPGFLVGHGIFETMRADLDGPALPHATGRHLTRLRHSAAITRIDLPHDESTLREGIATVTDEMRRRLTLDRTDDVFIRVRVTITAAGTTLITAMPAPIWPATTTIASIDAPINERNPLRGAKTISHLEETWCRLEAERLGVGEVVRTDTAGNLAEGSASNLFIVSRGRLLTPSLRTGCLPGITRALVLAATPAEERDDLRPTDLHTADEVFVTSSTRHVHPVERVDGRPLDAPGPVTTAVARRYRELLGSEPGP